MKRRLLTCIAQRNRCGKNFVHNSPFSAIRTTANPRRLRVRPTLRRRTVRRAAARMASVLPRDECSMVVDQERARQLLEELIEQMKRTEPGELTDPTWEAVFRRVPRHPFLSDFYVPATSRQRRYEQINFASDPERWWQCVYSDMALVTRVN